jgi:hypothetical protein
MAYLERDRDKGAKWRENAHGELHQLAGTGGGDALSPQD